MQMYKAVYRSISVVFGLLVLIAAGCQSNSGNDWPVWLGKDQAGVWQLDLQIDSLDQSGIEKIWEMPVGPGYSGPTVADGAVYVMDRIGEEERKERILCLDANTGEEIWSYSYPCHYSVGYPTGPRASVTIEDGLAYSFGTMGHLNCFNAKTGELVWSVNGQEQYEIDYPIWGLAASPLIEKDLLIVQMGAKPNACFVAFNKKTGEEVWRAIDDDAAYVTPIIIERKGERTMIAWTGTNLIGLNPENGQQYWEIPYRGKKAIINITSPYIQWPYVFVSSFYNGSMLVKLDEGGRKASMVWYRKGESERNTDALHAVISRAFIQGEYIYGIDSYGEFRCLELMSGDRVWTDSTLTPYGRWSTAHIVKQSDRIWAFNEKGELVLGKVSPEGFEDLGRVELLKPVRVSPNPRGGVNWAHPAFSGHRIYARSDGEIACYELK